MRIGGVVVVIVPRDAQRQIGAGGRGDARIADEVIEPQVCVDGIAVLGIDVAHRLGGQARVEVLRVVVSGELERRAVVAPDEDVVLVGLGAEVDFLARVGVAVRAGNLLVADPHVEVQDGGFALLPAAVLILFRLEFDLGVRLALVGRGHVLQRDLQVAGAGHAAQALLLHLLDLADEGLAVAVLVDRDLEEVVVDKLACAGLAAAAQLSDVVVARIAQLDIEGLVREHAVEHDLAVAGRPREAAAGIILQPVAVVVVDADGAVDIRRSGSASIILEGRRNIDIRSSNCIGGSFAVLCRSGDRELIEHIAVIRRCRNGKFRTFRDLVAALDLSTVYRHLDGAITACLPLDGMGRGNRNQVKGCRNRNVFVHLIIVDGNSLLAILQIRGSRSNRKAL